MNDSKTKLARQYFDYIAECFPVMCASDEFHFLPRAEMANQYYDQLDNLDRDRIHECLSLLKAFQNRCNLMKADENDLEKIADLELLKANASGILIELEMKESWRHNPLLYLKIAFIGLDHALTKPASDAQEITERTLARLHATPRLLQQAMDNINTVPKTYYEATQAMLTDCQHYLSELSRQDTADSGGTLTGAVQEAWRALEAFEEFLEKLFPVADQQGVVQALDATLKDHFCSIRSLAEIFEIAENEWRTGLEQLKELQANIDPSRSWSELYHAYSPSDIEKTDTIALYRSEIDRLGRFFREQGFREFDLSASLEVCETPTYLRSVRSSASFSAAFSADVREQDFFYITTQLAQQRGKEAANFVRKRLHREYKFLAAHETFPGHHLLDSVRRRLENPVRRQIESPLFYEGWAYYAESLLAEYGYVNNPMDYLVDCKRRIWRAARCQIDVGLTTGMLSKADAMALVTSAGFSPEEADFQIDHFQLNPGYQLCYCLGRHEIMQLRKNYGMKMGLDQFHKQLLEGGELPFHLVQERFEALDQSARRRVTEDH